MSDPIRIPILANVRDNKPYAEITPDIARQIVALALADVCHPLNEHERRIAALETKVRQHDDALARVADLERHLQGERDCSEQRRSERDKALSELAAAKDDAERAKMERNGMHVKNYAEWQKTIAELHLARMDLGRESELRYASRDRADKAESERDAARAKLAEAEIIIGGPADYRKLCAERDKALADLAAERGVNFKLKTDIERMQLDARDAKQSADYNRGCYEKARAEADEAMAALEHEREEASRSPAPPGAPS